MSTVRSRRIVLATIGTTGDVLPYAALGRALLARGHDVKACAQAVHRPLFERFGVELVPIGPEHDAEHFNRMLDHISRLSQPFTQFEMLAERVFLLEPRRQLQDHLAASRGADLVVAHWFDYVAQEAAIANGVPWITMTYMPEIFRTAEAPVFPFMHLGSWWARKTWDSAEELARPLAARVRALLVSLGGAPRPLALVGAMSPLRNLLAASRHLVEVRGDWPSNLVVTGPWFAEEPAYEPPAPLAEFLAENPRPVVVTFGSMGGPHAAESTALVLEALARCGRPAIVQRGYGGLDARPGPRIFAAEYVPHDWLFRHAGCVVHHAGSGTAAAVARAGAPSVPVPHLFDQYYWAGMLHRRGAAARPVFRAQLGAKVLAARIEEASSSRGMRERAAALGREVSAERGVARAVEEIEDVLASS